MGIDLWWMAQILLSTAIGAFLGVAFFQPFLAGVTPSTIEVLGVSRRETAPTQEGEGRDVGHYGGSDQGRRTHSMAHGRGQGQGIASGDR